ncbi:MAG TPA: HAMP domain-containing sensor histidine kinase, partial [Ideonella sp.]|nr:HAMP domain-containing sensor histidine kinase [Ideonella sp.]
GELYGVRFWAIAFATLAGLNGVVWGALPVLMWNPPSMIAQLLIALVIIGMATGSAALSATYLPAFFAFTLPAVVPLFARFAGAHDPMENGVAILLGIFVLFLAYVARIGGRMLRNSAEMRLRLEEMNHTLEHRVEERTQELASALRARDEFLLVASHELRTPLTSLKLQQQLLARELDATRTPRAAERLATMTRQTNRLTRLVNTLLDVSRIAEGRLPLTLRRSNVKELLDHVVAGLDADLKENQCTVRVDAPDDIVGRWDPDRLEQVITNIVVNAAKYGLGRPITLRARADEETATISVHDEGVGIPADALARIFGRYERLGPGRNDPGLGLGLYVVDQLVRAMGGRAWATSELGHGATLWISLPRGDWRPESAAHAPAPA